MPTPTQDGIFAKDDWTLAEATNGGSRLIVRIRSAMPRPADQALFCHLIIIKWLYEPNDFGMPDVAVHRRMSQFEDALESGTEKRQTAFQAACLTGSGTREWRFYTADVDEFMKSLNADLAGHEPYPLRIEMFHDPDWTALRELRGDSLDV